MVLQCTHRPLRTFTPANPAGNSQELVPAFVAQRSNASGVYTGPRCDLVHIDGDHSYQGARIDFVNLLPMMHCSTLVSTGVNWLPLVPCSCLVIIQYPAAHVHCWQVAIRCTDVANVPMVHCSTW